MGSPEKGLSRSTLVLAVLASDYIWDIGERMGGREPRSPDRPRDYPEWVMYLFGAMATITTTARKAAAEIEGCWDDVRRASMERFPDAPDLWAPAEPPERHHWQYAKKRLRLDSKLRPALDEFERISAEIGAECGIADPRGGGSLAHPDELRCLTGDGKVITPLFRAKPNTPIVDKETGEILGYKKFDDTAGGHVTGGGTPVWATSS